LAPMQPENDRTNPAAHILVVVGGRSNSSGMVGRCGRWNSNKSWKKVATLGRVRDCHFHYACQASLLQCKFQQQTTSSHWTWD
jgi:hypothetical protein